MLIRTVVSPFLETNCYVLTEAGRCVVVDPGAGVLDAVLTLVRDEELSVDGILATHGHVDHTWSAADLCDALDAPLLVHAADAYRLEDPFGSLGPLGSQLALMVGSGEAPRAPERVEPFDCGVEDRAVLLPTWADGGLRARHAPGHTQGSTVYLVAGPDGPTALTGDVLFAGSIGRTDLPGGDATTMATTLTGLAGLDPRTVVLPGHGPATTIGDELRSNPYLRAPG